MENFKAWLPLIARLVGVGFSLGAFKDWSTVQSGGGFETGTQMAVVGGEALAAIGSLLGAEWFGWKAQKTAVTTALHTEPPKEPSDDEFTSYFHQEGIDIRVAISKEKLSDDEDRKRIVTAFAAQFGEALAQWTEQGNVKSSDEWYRLAQQGEKLGLKIDVEKPASREVLDDRLRKEYAAKARAIK